MTLADTIGDTVTPVSACHSLSTLELEQVLTEDELVLFVRHQRRQLQCSLSLALQSINARSLLLPRCGMKIAIYSRHLKKFSDGLLSRF